MTTININEAKTHLSRYAKRVKAGETITLCDRNQPFAEIRPLPKQATAPKRTLGQLKGKIQFNDSFWNTDSQISDDFEASNLFPEVTDS